MRDKISKTCMELILGIVFLIVIMSFLGSIIMYMFTKTFVCFLLGNLLGGILACILVIHMDHCISIAVTMKPDAAEKYTKRSSFIRLIMMAVVLFVALTFPTIFNILGVLLGILALKLSVYLQPVTSKYITNK